MVCLVLTHLPDEAAAYRLARILVSDRLAACVQVGAPVRSVYQWQGQMEEAIEIPLIIKTLPGRIDEVKRTIVAHHPYDVPEILSVDAESSPAYLEWMQLELDNA
ncbi:MAG: divalent cation tolerance protein CutA [Proteobacteria bacterium]|nr:divalent cation tolerance protein CutA [Pseudomonadota bacterium]MDE3207792.1 divalent-cation tolerance protein CutA [Pseudomonadota bacterium]